MGDRYFIDVTCPECGVFAEGVYYAPTCDITGWVCKCGALVDLGEYTGITREEASNDLSMANPEFREGLRKRMEED